jgi:tripeptidyl-peptidase-1
VTRNATTGKSFAAVAEFQGQNAVPSDLAQFQSICGLPDKPMAKIVGPDSGGAGVEASLDVDAIAGVAPNVGLWFWGLEQYNLLEWIQQVAANDDAPHVHSVS